MQDKEGCEITQTEVGESGRGRGTLACTGQPGGGSSLQRWMASCSGRAAPGGRESSSVGDHPKSARARTTASAPCSQRVGQENSEAPTDQKSLKQPQAVNLDSLSSPSRVTREGRLMQGKGGKGRREGQREGRRP